MQHNLRDPSRDRMHGRIYRVTYEGRPLSKPAKIAGEPIEKLLDLLKEPEDRVRYRARIELGARDTDEVIAAVKNWVAGLDKNDPDYEHHLLEALWAHQYHNVVDVDLLKRVLASPDFHARAAATRVLCYWRDRVPDALDLLKKLAADPYPRVRLEAVRAASFFPVPEAVEVALDLGRPADRRVPRLRPRRDDEDARALLAEGDRRGQADRRSPATAGARFFLGTAEHRRAAQDEADARRSTSSCSSARGCATSSAARRSPTWRSSTRSPSCTVLIEAIRPSTTAAARPGRSASSSTWCGS